jgi:uncharacterized membrane protein
MDFIYFLGRFPVVVLHIPIGIIAAILFVEFMARKEKYAHLLPASPFLWNAAAVSAVVTVILGYMHFAEGGFEGSSGYQHRNFGTGLAVIISVVAVLRSSRFASAYAPVYLPAAVLMVFLVSLVGHYGGNLTHGSSYLVEYAPQPLRSLAGLAPRRPPVGKPVAPPVGKPLAPPVAVEPAHRQGSNAPLSLQTCTAALPSVHAHSIASPGWQPTTPAIVASTSSPDAQPSNTSVRTPVRVA